MNNPLEPKGTEDGVPTPEDFNASGSEPVYGPGFSGTHEAAPPEAEKPSQDRRAAAGPAPEISEDDFESPAYTAPYPPYPSDPPPAFGIAPSVAAGLAYFTPLPAVIFLILEPYRSSRLVRFHAWQSIFLFLAVTAVRLVLNVMGAMLPALMVLLLASLISLVALVVWIIAVVKAFAGKEYSLPVVGPLAERTAQG